MTPTTHRSRRRILAVGALIAILTTAACGGDPAKPESTAGRAGSPGPECTVSDSQQRDVLAANVTAALQAHDSKAFLALAGSAEATKAMTAWWANQDALGFDTGGAEVALDAPVADAAHPELEHTVTMDIGTHNPLDPSSIATGSSKQPNAPSSRYQLETRADGTKSCRLEITGWKALSNAPYDVAGKLYVKHTKHTVVAGEQQMRSEIDRVAPLAEKAAVWLKAFYQHNRRARDVTQGGFVAFVPTTTVQEQTWFRRATARKPKGWTADPGFVAGTMFPMSGVRPPNAGALPQGSPQLKPLGAFGGGRVLVTATGRKASDKQLEATFVHEFTHAVYAAQDLSFYLGAGKQAPAATAEGAARMVEAYFLTSPNAPAAKLTPADALGALRSGLAGHAASFSGRVPTNRQIYGPAKLGDFYYDLAATTFMSITGDTSFNLQCISDAYTNGGGPFSGIVEDTKGGTITFANQSTYEKDWASRIRKYL